MTPMDNTKLITFYIPADLAETFDDFIAIGINALDGITERDEWTDDERAIVEWLEKDRYKPSPASEGQIIPH